MTNASYYVIYHEMIRQIMQWTEKEALKHIYWMCSMYQIAMVVLYDTPYGWEEIVLYVMNGKWL